jgi:energy-coupling factor transporter ATP-binding protein EcfA2
VGAGSFRPPRSLDAREVEKVGRADRGAIVIELQDVVVERPGRQHPVLNGISLRIAPGERIALLGGNGSGKTTLARLLNGTELPASGRVIVDGHDTQDDAARFEVRRAVGLLFQDPDDQFVSTTADREIAFGLENLNVPTAEMRPRVDEALRMFGLESHRHASPHEMSGGEKARLALASVWVMQPRVLVLDETAALLDRRGREGLAAAIASLPAETIVIHVMTDAAEARKHARVVVLHTGSVVADGPPGAALNGLPAEAAHRVGAGGVRPAPRSAPDAPRAGSASALVRVQDLEVRWSMFGREMAPALVGVSFECARGERFGLMGASGAGKSTLFAALCGLLQPRRGRVEWPSAATGDARAVPSLVAQFAERQLFGATVREDVAYGLRESGVAAAEIDQRVLAALTDVGLDAAEFATRAPFHLSGGEMRRVALAGALAQQRPLLLLDEPTLGLDHEGVERLVEACARLHARGVTTCIASHDANFIDATCDRILVLNAGRLAYDGPAAELWSDPSRASRLGISIPCGGAGCGMPRPEWAG